MVKKNYDNMLSRFHPIPERYGQTDGRTDRIAISISRVSVLKRDKNRATFLKVMNEYQVAHFFMAHGIVSSATDVMFRLSLLVCLSFKGITLKCG